MDRYINISDDFIGTLILFTLACKMLKTNRFFIVRLNTYPTYFVIITECLLRHCTIPPPTLHVNLLSVCGLHVLLLSHYGAALWRAHYPPLPMYIGGDQWCRKQILPGRGKIIIVGRKGEKIKMKGERKIYSFWVLRNFLKSTW